MKDFRGIMEMSIAGKVYNKMLLNCIYDPIDNILRPFEARFRKGKICLEHIHILRKPTINDYYQRQLPLLAAFVDFSKAFDSVDRNFSTSMLKTQKKTQNKIFLI